LQVVDSTLLEHGEYKSLPHYLPERLHQTVGFSLSSALEDPIRADKKKIISRPSADLQSLNERSKALKNQLEAGRYCLTGTGGSSMELSQLGDEVQRHLLYTPYSFLIFEL